ncbi:MAG: hypothetical protein LJE68_06305 [Rhodobacter sp.]|nr:hypothetical protein [Rhodobacter sp.]
MSCRNFLAISSMTLALSAAAAAPGLAQTVLTTSNGIIEPSLCVGSDCAPGISFGADTIILKENNLRILFDDTSTAASFPRNDWRLTANDSANGGASKFSIDDVTAGRSVFTVTAGARANALFVDSQGDVGIGTSTPATDIDIKVGDSPTVRLQQDSSSGFAAQTWDMAGNETSFFIRDATGGSTLPFRVMAGGAPSQSLVIDGDGEVGIGAGTNPAAALHVRRSDGSVQVLVEETNATNAARQMIRLVNKGNPEIEFDNTNINDQWRISTGNNFLIKDVDGAATNNVFTLTEAGDLTITGEITTSGSCSIGCDRVFDAEYDLMPLERHAELMWENRHLPNVGATAEDAPMNLSAKVGGMLNELEHAHIYIDQLNQRIDRLERLIAQK